MVGGDHAFVTSSYMHDVVPSPGVDSVVSSVSSAMLVTGISKECISSTVIFGLHRCIRAVEGTI